MLAGSERPARAGPELGPGRAFCLNSEVDPLRNRLRKGRRHPTPNQPRAHPKTHTGTEFPDRKREIALTETAKSPLFPYTLLGVLSPSLLPYTLLAVLPCFPAL